MARIAGQAFGVVTRIQLLEAGLTPDQIRHRLHTGALIRVHSGVYRVGHAAPSTDASYLAAVYACGCAAVLGGAAAGWRYGTLKGAPPTAEVITPVRRTVDGVLARRVRLGSQDSVSYDLARACHEAGVRYRTTPRHVDAVLARRPNAKGAANLRAVMSGEARVSLSRLESRFLELLRENDLPLPETNRPAGGRRVDCRWTERRLTVELDSYGFHNSRHSWEQDHRREREAYARGDHFRRYTWGNVFEQPGPMLTELLELLR